MDPKRFIIVSTLAFAIAIGMWSDESSAASTLFTPKPETLPSMSETAAPQEERFLEALGAASEEEVYDALYNGQSLADVAEANQVDVQHIIDLQVEQMESQLHDRLVRGAISLDEYALQMTELTSIITQSVHA